MSAEEKQQAKTKEKLTAILEKFKTNPEQAAEEFANLQAKLGEQGAELGEARKKYEQAAAQMQQYQAWAQQVNPFVQWWNQHGQLANQLIQQHLQNPNGIRAQAQTQAQNTPGYELLTKGEKEALTRDIAQHLTQQALAPWTQNFAQTAERWAQQQLAAQQQHFDQKLRAYGDVMWKTWERILPAEKVAEAKRYQEEALKYADPSKLNPMEMANESLSIHSKLAAAEARAKELEEKLAERERSSVPSLGNGTGLFPTQPKEPSMPLTREDRMKASLDAVKEAHSNDGYQALFGR
ncbi:MAG TPA: hypothetical protein VLA99_02755 [Nitrospiraceae bacterium]|nr:hypothetical protein [Nitrospiraceae bacterium]